MKVQTFVRITLPLASVNMLTQAARTVMSTVGPIIAVRYGLNAGELGALSAVMFASYCLTQIPVGIAMDRWGVRRVSAALCLVAAIGFAVFASADSITGFVLGRLFIGIGVASGLIGMLKGNSEWFLRHEATKATGFGMAVGTLGSLLVTTPAQAVLPFIGWHGVVWCCAGAALLSGIWNLLSVRDQTSTKPASSLWQDIQDLVGIICTPAYRRFAPIAGLLTVLNFTYLGLWAGPWLRDVSHLNAQIRANVLLLYTVGLFIGGPLMGSLVSATQRHRRHPMLVPAISTVLLVAIQIALACQPRGIVSVSALWFGFAIFASCGSAAYAAIASFYPSAQTGRVSTAVNSLTLVMVFIMQIIIGQIVDRWPQTANGGWNPQGYSVALVLTVLLQIAALIYAWMKSEQLVSLQERGS